MSKVIDFFRLIRFTNIIFIALTQLLFQYCIISPMLNHVGIVTTLNTFDFFLLTFSTTLVAAAGYIINDYFDEKIDAINKPDKVFIEKSIRRRVAMGLHFAFNGLATLIGVYLALKTHNYKMALINPIVSVLLWFYSTTFKRQYLTGNIVVSFLCALTVIVPILYEKQLFHSSDELLPTAHTIIILMDCYVLFAFLTTMIREIVKDMEDVQGDTKYDCRTLPVVSGLRVAKRLTMIITLVTLVLILFILAYVTVYYGGSIPLIYISLLIIIPMLYFIYRLYTADLQIDYHQLSTIIKLIIFTGILSMSLIWFGFINL